MKLSIITINYNNIEGLRKTINSVVSQTWQDFEWIIVDGGSTDGSRELIEKTVFQLSLKGWGVKEFSISTINNNQSLNADKESSNPPFVLWCSEKDKGIYNAMNKGIVLSKGEFLLFMNSGDSIYDKYVLSNVSDKLKEKDVYVGTIVIVNGDDFRTNVFPQNLSSKDLLEIFILKGIPHQASFIRKSLFDNLGFYREDVKIVADWYFFYRACVMGNATIGSLDFKIALYDGNGISSNCTNLHKERENSLADYPLQQFLYRYYRDTTDLMQAFRSNRLGRFIMRFYFFLYRNFLK